VGSDRVRESFLIASHTPEFGSGDVALISHLALWLCVLSWSARAVFSCAEVLRRTSISQQTIQLKLYHNNTKTFQTMHIASFARLRFVLSRLLLRFAIG
jgi:hypothetical protein